MDRRRKICIVGLGRLGSAYLSFAANKLSAFELVTGFDSNVNRAEVLSRAGTVPLYPAYKMAEVIGRFEIEIAVLCVPEEAAQEAAQKCAESGIRGILNFTGAVLQLPGGVTVRNISMEDELQKLLPDFGE